MYSISRIFACSTLLVCLFAGCATTEPAGMLKTPTGKADVIIANASKAEIADRITNAMLSSDFQTERIDQDYNVLSFVKRHSEKWTFRYTYNIVNHPPEGVRVLTNITRIMNPGRRDQVVTDISRNSKEAESAYALLTRIRDGAGSEKTAKDHPKTGLGMTMKDYTITSVAPGGAAERSGLQQGDVILEIDGEPISGDEMKDAVRINGRPGATVHLLIKRSGQELVIPLAR